MHIPQGELDVVLDLINLLEAQYYLGVANIARPSNVQLEEQERALQLQQKVCQLQVCLSQTAAVTCILFSCA